MTPSIHVATDASMRSGVPGVAIAWVSAAGVFETDWLPQQDNILLGELSAMSLCVGSTKSAADLVIHSDSRPAVSIVNRAIRCGDAALVNCSVAVRTAVQEYLALMSGSKPRRVRLEWVRGHNGDPLNQAADELAVLTRRARESSRAVDLASESLEVLERLGRALVIRPHDDTTCRISRRAAKRGLAIEVVGGLNDG